MKKKDDETCPASGLLKSLSGKWKADIFRLSIETPVRFSKLQQQLPNASRQSLSVALRGLEEEGLISRVVIKEKPLNVEYHLTEKGRSLTTVFEQLEQLC